MSWRNIIAIILWSFIITGCASAYKSTCCDEQIRTLQELTCEDSMFIGFMAAQLPPDQWKALTEEYRKAIENKQTGCHPSKK